MQTEWVVCGCFSQAYFFLSFSNRSPSHLLSTGLIHKNLSSEPITLRWAEHTEPRSSHRWKSRIVRTHLYCSHDAMCTWVRQQGSTPTPFWLMSSVRATESLRPEFVRHLPKVKLGQPASASTGFYTAQCASSVYKSKSCHIWPLVKWIENARRTEFSLWYNCGEENPTGNNPPWMSRQTQILPCV